LKDFAIDTEYGQKSLLMMIGNIVALAENKAAPLQVYTTSRDL
jgi:hypothetical protein